MEQELDLETGIRVLEFLEEAKYKILEHVMETATPAERIQVLDACIASSTEVLAKISPQNLFVEPDTREEDLLKSDLVQAAGWGKTYAQITQTMEDLKRLLGAPPETEEGRRFQALRH